MVSRRFSTTPSRCDHGEPTDQHSEIMTKKQAATLLGISVRQIDRLPIPRSYAAGERSPRYLREDIIAFIKGARVDPVTVRTNVGGSKPVLSRRKSGAGGDWLRTRLAALK